MKTLNAGMFACHRSQWPEDIDSLVKSVYPGAKVSASLHACLDFDVIYVRVLHAQMPLIIANTIQLIGIIHGGTLMPLNPWCLK